MPRCPVWYVALQASALEFKCMNRPDGHCRKLQIPVVINGQRRVVAEALVFIDGGLFRRCGDAGRGDVVIDAPPHILGPGLAAVAPPGVLVGLGVDGAEDIDKPRSEEHTSELQSLMRISYAVFCLKKKKP